MELTMQIPDDLAERLRASGPDLSRRALEAWVAEEYRAGRLNKPDLRRLLGLETSGEIDGFLKAHGVYENCSIADIDNEVDALTALGV
jgi:hypothetical protein